VIARRDEKGEPLTKGKRGGPASRWTRISARSTPRRRCRSSEIIQRFARAKRGRTRIPVSRSRARSPASWRTRAARSRFIIATGQSGHIFSKHYRDLLPLWRAGKSIALSGTEEELKVEGATLTVFGPANNGP